MLLSVVPGCLRNVLVLCLGAGSGASAECDNMPPLGYPEGEFYRPAGTSCKLLPKSENYSNIGVVSKVFFSQDNIYNARKRRRRFITVLYGILGLLFIASRCGVVMESSKRYQLKIGQTRAHSTQQPRSQGQRDPGNKVVGSR